MLDRVIATIKKTYMRQDIVLTKETNLLEDLSLNSLEIAELMCAFEDEFGVEIPDRILPRFRVINDIVEYLLTHLE